MKKILCLLAVLLPAALHAQSYSINWYKIAGGGGTSAGTNGSVVYAVSGTIGQPDASKAMTGGNYSLVGGFWSLYAVQTLGAPLLNIILTGTNTAIVSWPSPSTGYALQYSTNLAKPGWLSAPQIVNDNGTIRYIIVSPPTGKQFYRLVNP